MESIQVLMDEHRFILRLLGALSRWAAAPRRDRVAMQRELGRFVAVVEGFVDPIHHGKEEDILFRTMTEHGFPSAHGPLPCMLAEHARCRALVAELHRLADSPAPWDEIQLGAATAAASQYADYLSAHISKEDHVLYPMAQRFLITAVRDEVDSRCAEFADAATRARADALVADGEALIAALDKVLAATPPPAAHA